MNIKIPIYPGSSSEEVEKQIAANTDKNLFVHPKKHQILDKWERNKLQQVFLTVSLFWLIPWFFKRIIKKPFNIYRVDDIFVQKINSYEIVLINDFIFYSSELDIDHGLNELALNEGFKSGADFLNYYSKLNSAYLVHWTDTDYSKNLSDSLH